MKRQDKRIKLIAGTVLLIAVAYWGYDQWREVRAGKEVKQMTEKMVTYCVGRYLIDLPQDTEVNYGATRIDGVDISYLEPDAKQPLFDERLKAREEELKEKKNQKGQQSLESAEPVNHSGLTGKILKHSYESIELDEGDKKILAEGNTVEAWLKSAGAEYRLNGESLDKKYIGNVSRLVLKLRPLSPNKIPAEPGFCFERGIILDPPGPDQNESIVLHFRLKKNQDVVGNLSISSNGDKLSETLLERDARDDSYQRYLLQIRRIFKGERVINNIPGQEVSIKFSEAIGTSSHSFIWDTVGKSNDVFAPSITFDMDTGYGPPGKRLNSSLPDKAANALWQKISGSIRLRPTTPGKTSDAGNGPTPPTSMHLPLGTKVTSASNCPQSGIWECAPNTPGIPDHRRYIEAGQPMPHGLTQSAARGLTGFLGKQEDKPEEVTWTLAAYTPDKP